MNNVGAINKIPLLSLSTLWLAYALLGWYLSAHHVAWLVGAFVVFIAKAIVWKSSPLFKQLYTISSRGLLAVILASLIVSLSVSLAITWSTSFAFIAVPFITTFFVQFEMGINGFNKSHQLLLLTLAAGLGLLFGEVLDIAILPSVRY